MLFDLRGAGRRRMVKVVYTGLAVIFFVGFVGFSIGSSGLGGGFLDIIRNGGGGGSSDTSTKRFQQQADRAATRARTSPQDAAAWAALAQARVRLAGVGDNFDNGKSDYTASGRQELQRAATAWNKYLDLDPKHPDVRLARQMLQAFVSLNQPAGAVSAQEIVTDDNPTAATFAQLATYAYAAGQTRKGDLASQKAVSLAPKAQRKTLKQQLAQQKSQASGAGSTTGG
jgi:hypothetical protein